MEAWNRTFTEYLSHLVPKCNWKWHLGSGIGPLRVLLRAAACCCWSCAQDLPGSGCTLTHVAIWTSLLLYIITYMMLCGNCFYSSTSVGLYALHSSQLQVTGDAEDTEQTNWGQGTESVFSLAVLEKIVLEFTEIILKMYQYICFPWVYAIPQA